MLNNRSKQTQITKKAKIKQNNSQTDAFLLKEKQILPIYIVGFLELYKETQEQNIVEV